MRLLARSWLSLLSPIALAGMLLLPAIPAWPQAALPAPAPAPAPAGTDLIGSWVVRVAGESRPRILRVFTVAPRPGGSFALEALYGFADVTPATLTVEVSPAPDGLRLALTTQANNRIAATQATDGSFRGTFTSPTGASRAVTLSRKTESDDYDQSDEDSLDNPDSIATSMSAEERARLQDLLRRPPPEDALKSTLARFYREQHDAANKLGDGRAQLFFSGKFAEAAQGTRDETTARIRRWRAEWRFGSAVQALKTGEELLERTPRGETRAEIAAILAQDHLSKTRDLKRAEELLGLAQEALRTARGTARTRLPVERELALLRNGIEGFKGRFREAIPAAESAVSLSEQIVNSDPESRVQRLRAHLGAHIALWKSLSAAGHGALAEAKATDFYVSFMQKEQFNNQVIAKYLRVLGELKLDARKYDEAVKLLTRSLRLGASCGLHANNSDMYGASGNLAAALTALGRHDEAMRQCDTRIRLKQRYFETSCGLAYYAGRRFADALRLTRSNVKYWTGILPRERHRVVMAEGLLGATLVARGEREEGRLLLESAIARLPDAKAREPWSHGGVNPFLEKIILGAYLETLAEDHARATDAQVRRALAAEAFKVATMMRTSVVQQSAQDAALRSAAGEAGLSDLVRTLQDGQSETRVLYDFLTRQLSEPPARQLPEVVTSMRARIAALDAEQKRIEAAIAQKFPAFRELMRPSVPTPQEIAERLRPGEAFLLLTPGPGGTHAWAIAKDGFEYARAPLTSAELATAVRRLRHTLELDDGDVLHPFDAATASSLYRQLVVPVERVLTGKTALLVSADGALARLPFGVLLTEEPKSTDPAAQPYLIRRFAVSHAVSPAAWLAQVKFEPRSRQAASGFVGFGDPVFSTAAPAAAGGTLRRVRNLAVARAGDAPASEDPAAASNVAYASLSPLPETRDEVLAIAATLKADPARDVYLNLRASRKNVLEARLADRSVVMFATHGLMAGDLPTLDEPGLALSVTGPEDSEPVLKVSDVLKLRLNADWVVLSACNTAAGDKASDETYSGLGRAFFYAGARALLLTHWAVETNSAKALTTQLFELFARDAAMTRAEALRRTQLALIGSKARGGPDYAHPFFWAPFALVGDGAR